jgi:hypothetical protein
VISEIVSTKQAVGLSGLYDETRNMVDSGGMDRLGHRSFLPLKADASASQLALSGYNTSVRCNTCIVALYTATAAACQRFASSFNSDPARGTRRPHSSLSATSGETLTLCRTAKPLRICDPGKCCVLRQ